MSKLGIIAGGGVAPRQVMAACREAGRDFFVICLEGNADPDMAGDAPHVWLPLGAGARLKEVLAEQGIREIVMIGHVRRPSLTEIRPDWLALKILTKIGISSLGDDGLLRALGKAIETETGARVIGAHEVFADLLAPAGALTKVLPDEAAQADIQRGVEVAQALGLLDVGQAVVVQQGIVLGVEAAEGTDALLQRCSTLRRQGQGGVLVKLAKPQQDRRFDLPTVGPSTVESALKAGLRGIAYQAGRSLLVERERAVALADSYGLFFVGISVNADPQP